MASPIPLTLYIHMPWCEKKCPYCDFNSHENFSRQDEDAYITRLIADLEQELPFIWGRRINSIFIGGGTPSLFSPASYDRLLSGIRALLPFQQPMEITLEANPGTTDADKFADYFALGINRLSIGVQSFNDKHLKQLGRIHTSAQAEIAIEQARRAGYTNINLDLMHGLPGQSTAEAEADLRRAIAFNTPHLSWYQLTIEPNTAFAHRPPTLPLESTLLTIQQLGIELLADSGFDQYEVSAYSKSDKVCNHNLNYWQFGDYIGIGAGAHGKITHPSHGILRKHKQRHPKAYLNADQPLVAGETTLEKKDLPFEFMLNALRLKQGVPSNLYQERTGQSLETIRHLLTKAQAKGLLAEDAKRLVATPEGFQFLNDLVEMFLIDSEKELQTVIPIQVSH